MSNLVSHLWTIDRMLIGWFMTVWTNLKNSFAIFFPFITLEDGSTMNATEVISGPAWNNPNHFYQSF